MKHAWKKNNYECGLRYSTVAKDTKLSRITVRRTLDTLEKLNIISTVRGKSGKSPICEKKISISRSIKH
jgi:DNA-binding transcriptional regulator YhcF (GntR family)